jgi:GNAT superfamily N-acetyltransferase
VSTGIEGLARDGATGEDTRVRTAEQAPQRVAVAADAEEIQALMQASIRAHFPRFYDPRHTDAAARYIGELDGALIEDGTYYVHEAGGEIVACGGWSKRNRLYTGSGAAADDGRLLDPATEPARVRAMFVRDDWSRRGLGRAILERCERDARAAGFTQMALMATLPGEPLYRAYGFVETDRVMVRLPDGTELDGVAMERPIDPA